jgi:uncharacterized protein YggE
MTINFSSKQLLEVIQTLLIVIILGMLVWSKPWDQQSSSQTRKITVSGQATIEAEPDEYTFSPYFQKTGSDREALKTELTKSTNEAVAKLKELGVEEKDIKVDASSYEYWYNENGSQSPMTFSLQISVSSKELVQKVQDYLLTLDLEGQLTPQATFSEDKRKELDKQAIEKASDDAKSKADAQAKLLGTKLGKVIEVSQGSESIFPIAYDAKLSAGMAESDASRSSMPVLPGQNEYTQTVSVTYELK